jgi:hypothetical protein
MKKMSHTYTAAKKCKCASIKLYNVSRRTT